MARLLPLLILLVLFAIFVIARQRTRPRSDRVYRPHSTPWGRRTARAGDANWVVNRAEVADVRDAYSSETIDPKRALFRCGGCQAWYHEASVRTLERDNAGRCALCGSVDLRGVRVV